MEETNASQAAVRKRSLRVGTSVLVIGFAHSSPVNAGCPLRMSTIQLLRAFVSQRLTAAVEEIIGAFERTISEYEEEIDRQRRLLEAGRQPGIGAALNNQTGL